MKLVDVLKELLKRFSVIQKPLLIRDYRRSKAELFIVKKQLIPNYNKALEKINQEMSLLDSKSKIRKIKEIQKKKYEAKLKMLEDVEQPYLENHLSELSETMSNLGMRLE